MEAARTADAAADGPEAKRSRRRARLWKLLAFSLAVVALAVLTLRGRFPSIPHILATIADANWGWVAVAAGVQAISIVMFALQERVLLRALGVRIRVRRITAIALSRTALSISLPAGAAVSAGYAMREYRRAGASNEVAAAVMVVAGLVSIAGLAAVYVCGVLGVVAQDPAAMLTSPGPLAVLGLFAVILVASGVRRLRGGRPARRTGPRPEPRRAWTRYARRLLDSALDAWRAGASLKPQHWAISLAYAAANWLFDLLCLAGSTRALGLPIGVTTLAGIYLGVQVVRQIPITPGGVGLIETAFIAGLTAAGTSAASATAAVLIYRVLSCWLVLPAGGLAALALRGARDWSAAPRSTRPAA